MYPYGLIGNCQASALISRTGSFDWLCLPRPDSEPIFGKLLDPNGGSLSILPVEGEPRASIQRYEELTNILVTEIRDEKGHSYRMTDFFPRYEDAGQIYRPTVCIRILEPIDGHPWVRFQMDPVCGWIKERVRPTRGPQYLEYSIRDEKLRLSTNLPLTYLNEPSGFALQQKTYFVLSWSTPLTDYIPHLCEEYLEKTRHYWKTWVKHCSIPTLFQKETIRSALALKLHCFEDTGAILAALTTSLPEQPGAGRNWDYRFCWLRDAHFALSAFHNLGHFEETEGFLKFLLGIAAKHESSRERLAPVYSLTQDLPKNETIQPEWLGYGGSGPVRTENQAAEHIQNDVYREMILTLAPIFFDHRFVHLRTPHLEDLLSHLARLCERSISSEDAGLWEIRNGWQEHSFTNLMTWAGLERMSRIQAQGDLKNSPVATAEARDWCLPRPPLITTRRRTL